MNYRAENSRCEKQAKMLFNDIQVVSEFPATYNSLRRLAYRSFPFFRS